MALFDLEYQRGLLKAPTSAEYEGWTLWEVFVSAILRHLAVGNKIEGCNLTGCDLRSDRGTLIQYLKTNPKLRNFV